MAEVRIKDISNTATEAAEDDYIAIDGAVGGTRRILASMLGGGGGGSGYRDFSTPQKIGTLNGQDVMEAYILEENYTGWTYNKTITFADYGVTDVDLILSIDGIARKNDGWSYIMFSPNNSGSSYQVNGFNGTSIGIYDANQSGYKAFLHMIYTKAAS